MEALYVKDFRKNLAASFKRADLGERVLIRRNNQLYALISIGKEELTLTPQLQARIDEAEEACRKGQCVTCSSKEEIEQYLSSL